MDINKHCKLVLRNIYLYDIRACHYTILERLGFNLSDIDRNNKKERNIQIGKLMRENPRLVSVLRSQTNYLVDEYLLRNKVSDDELILRQYDGIIVTRTLTETIKDFIPLELRSMFEVFIISFDRSKYLAFDGIEAVIKGVPYRYERIDQIYNEIIKINFNIPSRIFKRLQEIKDKILFSKDPEMFCIPIEGGDKYTIILKELGNIEITKQTTKMMELNDVDKQWYFDFYIKPFTKSIVVEFA